MHLQRIRVPDFRVLKDVDITFENDFVPRIFPLGSLNGGGKSTLLQLIFTLLHCSTDPEKKPFLQNLLDGFNIREGSPKRTLAIIDIWDKDKVVTIEFFVCQDSDIKSCLSLNDKPESIYNSWLSFSVPEDLEDLNSKISVVETEIAKLENIKMTIYPNDDNDVLDNQEVKLPREIQVILNSLKNSKVFPQKMVSSIEKIPRIPITYIINACRIKLNQYGGLIQKLESASSQIQEYIKKERLLLIVNYKSNKNDIVHENVLLCNMNYKGLNVDDMDDKINEIESILRHLSQKIFLAAPSTQVFLFMEQEKRSLLFKSKAIESKNYYLQIQAAKSQLMNLFTYDFLAVDILIQAFKNAFERDITEAIETGDYGNHYHNLKNKLNQMLFNKKINIDKDLNGVNFTLDRNGETIELSPEDLSHGELKRLSIYMWLKHHKIEDAIVLMDEIEIAFHPDWQYQIIRDLQEWAPNNQYILATHSYELCQALTPAHVKELEPKLIKQDPEN
ncbi:MAG: AAA family ATPase [Coleofasciculus sp. D1-CHI-01]|uniref:AAA family ATPase n=1 Tax=Coleofasciculus sp. D1-CHI-01 TaxID=3068482 RepID=UPI0032F0D204